MTDNGRCRNPRPATALRQYPGYRLPALPLPRFVTPEWLAARYRLTQGDIRVLSRFLAENYADWPDAGTAPDPATFFANVHEMARRWPHFFLDLSRMIETLAVKRTSYSISLPETASKPAAARKLFRKCMLWTVLEAAGDEPAEEVRELTAIAGEAIENAQGQERDEILWLLNFNRLVEPDRIERADVDPQVQEWLDQFEFFPDTWPTLHLVSKMLATPDGPVLRHLIDDARREADRLDGEAAWLLRELQAVFATFDTATDMVEAHFAHDINDLTGLVDDAEVLRQTAGNACAEIRAAELHMALADAVGALCGDDGATERRLRDRLGTLDLVADPPGRFPDADWERCREQVAVFGAVSDEGRRRTAAAQAAAEAYARDATERNLAALTAATSAVNAPLPAARLDDAFDALEMTLLGLRETHADWSQERDDLLYLFWKDEPGDGEEDAGPGRAFAATAALAEERARHEDTRAELARVVEEAARERDALAGDRRALDDELSRTRAELRRLGGRAAAAGGEPSGGPAADGTAVPFPGTFDYGLLPEWTARHLGDRVALHPRALRALEKARFENPELVFRSVALLGTRYWMMRTRSVGDDAPRREYNEALGRLLLEDTPSASDSSMGLARDRFDIDWEGRRLILDRHLKNRTPARDPRRCFRVYFTWDEASRTVLIGHLPGHLTTRSS